VSFFFFFSSRRRHTRSYGDWSSDVCSSDLDLYVTDGYGNARVHRFAPDGCLRHSWGDPGRAPGQFNLPHGIAVGPDGTVYVADRENSRVQRFDPEGAFLSEWTDVARPCQVAVDARGNLLVAELGFQIGRWPGMPEPDES